MPSFLSHPWWTGLGVLVTVAGLALAVLLHLDRRSEHNVIGPNATCVAQGTGNRVSC